MLHKFGYARPRGGQLPVERGLGFGGRWRRGHRLRQSGSDIPQGFCDVEVPVWNDSLIAAEGRPDRVVDGIGETNRHK